MYIVFEWFVLLFNTLRAESAWVHCQHCGCWRPGAEAPVAFFTKEVYQQLPKQPLKTNGHLATHWLTSLVKEATGLQYR